MRCWSQIRSTPVTYLTSQIAISCSPCIHPRDIQVVTAISQPSAQAFQLASLVNCVVFSIKGTYSLPSCLGGGDLNGDLYMLITDPNLIPHPFNLHPPAKYAPPKMFQLENPCMHLQIAEASILDSKDPDCLLLSQLHSDAVDYAKTGVAVDYTELPKAGKVRPELMSPEFVTAHQHSTNNKYYKSTKVFSQLFCNIPVEVLEEDTMKELQCQWRGDQRGRAGLDDEERLKKTIQNLIMMKEDGVGWWEVEEDEMRCLVPAFGEEYQNRWNIIKIRSVYGVIAAASTTDRRERQEMRVQLINQTSELFEMLRSEIMGEIEEEEEECCLGDQMSSIDLHDNDDDDDDDDDDESLVKKKKENENRIRFNEHERIQKFIVIIIIKQYYPNGLRLEVLV
ncbi:hypothetical protein CROQUDRAFT_134745 [Cronartium quercuum f. sp. fusiforme G11]|uniref:RNA-dependent RNA polymerase n=1 Tax=Cronartium quercuum f. sp. fusiforme G11 TaxID=708437 RepID=A0A9P6TAR3_9BASI|nr:hypothetical protein CROQUDRAFT_134745 [Cronartium quercuum f. sp. fusiforme G11]